MTIVIGERGLDRARQPRLSNKRMMMRYNVVSIAWFLFIFIISATYFCPTGIPNWLPNISHFEVIHPDKHGQESTVIMVDDLERLGLTPREPVIIKDTNTGREKKLYGRFLHITDMHPDPFYKEGTSLKRACHNGEPGGHNDKAPKFGKPMGECDSPMILMELTLDWITKNLRDKIDFVIWTGDNIRHDNDRKIPRTEVQIFGMNELIAGKMRSMFASPDNENPRDFDVEVIPSIGNNDVFPHNLFSLGPTLQTREFYKIWHPFVPEEQQRMFDKAASFFTEIIPGKLAVLSINTLYLYKANPLVDNCNSSKEPGYQLLLWLGYVLEELRNRGMKVWLSGHVPPIPKNYDISCFHKFNLWTHEYRDIIVGGVYGHMNMDHFIPLNGKKSRKYLESPAYQDSLKRLSKKSLDDLLNYENGDDDDISEHALAAGELHGMGAKPFNKESYMKKVKRTFYQKIHDQIDDVETLGKKSKGGKKNKDTKYKPIVEEDFMEKYSIVNIAGSVIPTFNPSFRVWEYNITELGLGEGKLKQKSWDSFFKTLESNMKKESDNFDSIFNKYNEKLHTSLVNTDKTIPKKMPKSLPLGPAYVPQLFTPTKFVQYYADLDAVNGKYYSELKNGTPETECIDKAFDFKIEYQSDDKPYPMKSLLVKDYLELASLLIDDNKVWDEYIRRAFISSGYSDDI